jgi:hypothetical protein
MARKNIEENPVEAKLILKILQNEVKKTNFINNFNGEISDNFKRIDGNDISLAKKEDIMDT